jgi:hypothetical protein
VGASACAAAGPVDRHATRAVLGDVVGVARALLEGGAARVEDPESPELPRWIASIERLLPGSLPSAVPGAQPRSGVWSPACPSGANTAGPSARVAELVAAAWRDPDSRAAEAWTLLCELATARGESLDQIAGALASAELDAGAVLTAAERAELTERAGRRRAVDVLHAWGRGRFDRSQTAGTLTARLADLVGLRALAQLAAGSDPRGAIAEARWHALLSARRRAALLAAVAQRTRSLRALVEANHA